MPHSIIHGDACFAYFNKIWGIPAALLNRCCAFVPDLESMFRDEMLKILLQQYRPDSDLQRCPLYRRYWGMSGHAADIAKPPLLTDAVEKVTAEKL
jgi:hypothetical protein